MDCSTCSLLETINNFSSWLMGIAFFVTILLVILAGYFYISDTGKSKSKSKRFLTYAVWGFVLTLVSFLLVSTTYYVSGAKQETNWFQFSCTLDQEQEKPQDNEIENSLDTAYLEKNKDQIITSSNLNKIVSGDNRIIKLSPDALDAENLLEDIKLLLPEREIKFILGSREADPEEIIEYKNIDLGFDQDYFSNYETERIGEALLGENLKDKEGKIEELFSLNTTDADGYYLTQSGEILEKYLGSYAELNDEGLTDLVNALVQMVFLSDQENKDIYTYVSGDPVGQLDECVDSGGDMNMFQNKCYAEKEQYEKRNLKCSDMYNPVYECDCPEGSYMVGERCQEFGINQIFNKIKDTLEGKKENDNRKVEEEEEEEVDKSCLDIYLEEKKCPASRCEGDVMMIYPESVKDKCVETNKGVSVKKATCTGKISTKSEENQKCKELLSQKSLEDKRKEAEDLFNKNGQSPDWYDKILDKEFGKGNDVEKGGPDSGNSGSGGSGSGDNGNNGTGQDKGPGNGKDNGQLPPDKGAGNFNPAPTFKDLKECIGLKDDQIPYNGILVVLLNPNDPLNRRHVENISRMYYLARDGKLIGKNGSSATELGGQEYGARTFDKSTSGSPNGPSMWGRGWKIFKGPTKYDKGGWTDHCSYGSHDGFKIGDYNRNDQGNLGGGKVQSMGRCGQHIKNKYSSAGCATMGDSTRCGFINTSKSYMTKSNGTIMQINMVGELNSSNGKFSSPDCGKIDYCAAKRSFENSSARKFHNDPNDGYSGDDKRRVKC